MKWQVALRCVECMEREGGAHTLGPGVAVSELVMDGGRMCGTGGQTPYGVGSLPCVGSSHAQESMSSSFLSWAFTNFLVSFTYMPLYGDPDSSLTSR